MKAKRLAALEAGNSWDFSRNDYPKCPHCGDGYSIEENESWELYDEGDQEVECPACDMSFTVAVHVSYRFSTDEQEEEDDE